jgi:hypothetical protein
VGKHTFKKSANPQILGLIPLLNIRKFLRFASPQSASPQIFVMNPQSSKSANLSYMLIEKRVDPQIKSVSLIPQT